MEKFSIIRYAREKSRPAKNDHYLSASGQPWRLCLVLWAGKAGPFCGVGQRCVACSLPRGQMILRRWISMRRQGKWSQDPSPLYGNPASPCSYVEELWGCHPLDLNDLIWSNMILLLVLFYSIPPCWPIFFLTLPLRMFQADLMCWLKGTLTKETNQC